MGGEEQLTVDRESFRNHTMAKIAGQLNGEKENMCKADVGRGLRDELAVQLTLSKPKEINNNSLEMDDRSSISSEFTFEIDLPERRDRSTIYHLNFKKIVPKEARIRKEQRGIVGHCTGFVEVVFSSFSQDELFEGCNLTTQMLRWLEQTDVSRMVNIDILMQIWKNRVKQIDFVLKWLSRVGSEVRPTKGKLEPWESLFRVHNIDLVNSLHELMRTREAECRLLFLANKKRRGVRCEPTLVFKKVFLGYEERALEKKRLGRWRIEIGANRGERP
ncbi:uncharacterized protein TNCV_4439921 [Trichonephila clavipes]|nr:uncharacterized protein TNCV_4439921 [Trichonephila clavipes]